MCNDDNILNINNNLNSSNEDNYSFDNKYVLMIEIINIMSMLNQLIDLVDNDNLFDGKENKILISDKVNYFLKNCVDLDLCNKIENLYKEYVFKRNILVQLNLEYVIKIAKRIYKKNVDLDLDLDELIQYGNIGLIRAIETYKPENRTEFTTYLWHHINRSIIYNSQKNMCALKVPRSYFDLNDMRNRAIDNLIKDLGRYPNDNEIADYMGISLSKLYKVVNLFAKPLLLDDFSGIYMDGIEILESDFIADDNVDIEETVCLSELYNQVKKCMNSCLSDREKYILRSIFGFDAEMSVKEVADVLGITHQRVAQIKYRALTKMCVSPEFKKISSTLR